MRLLICTNKLPPQCDITGLEPINFHWHKDVWRRNASRAFVIQAFSNEWQPFDPHESDGPLCLDLELPDLWDGSDPAKYQAALNLQTEARQRTKSVFPGRELWSYDTAGGYTDDSAMVNACAARQAFDGLDGAFVSFYNGQDDARDTAQWWRNIKATRAAISRCWPVPMLGICVSPHRGGGPDGSFTSLNAFEASLKSAWTENPDAVCLWQSKFLVGNPPDEKFAEMLDPYIKMFREVFA